MTAEPHTGRQQPAQQAPPPGIDLTGFPFEVVPTDAPIYRAHTRGNGPWWFGRSGQGRFDLTSPRGTCYAADAPAPAIRERLGPLFTGGGRAPARLVDDTAVTEIHVPRGWRGAAIEDDAAAGFPLTGELVTMVSYEIPRAWATAFDQAGLAAIHYRGRFSHAFGVACWALFGDEGASDYGVGTSLSGRECCAAAGIDVMPPPPTDASTLRVIMPT